MILNLDHLVIVAIFCLLFSLAIAWLASFIVYGNVGFLKALFPAPFQLIRAHIDYLMMAMLLGFTHYLCTHYDVTLSTFTIFILCFGVLYNPFGFLVLAVKPEMRNPKTFLQKARIMIGFLPVTIGFCSAMLEILNVIIS